MGTEASGAGDITWTRQGKAQNALRNISEISSRKTKCPSKWQWKSMPTRSRVAS